jgi:N-acetylneuraminic acid mutarotase
MDRKLLLRWSGVMALGLVLALAASVSATPSTINGRWTPIADMNVSRGYHTLTPLRDGRLLAVGGVPIHSVDKSAEIYDPSANTWTLTPPTAYQYALHTAVALTDGRVLVTGGFVKSDVAEVYNPSTNTWGLVEALHAGRYGHTATVLRDGRVLVVGGCDAAQGGCTLRSAELFDPNTNRWTQTGSLNVGRGWHAALLLPNGQVMVSGGTGGSWPLKSTELYDPASGTWSLGPDMNDGRMKHSLTAIQRGRERLILAAGGCCVTGDWLTSLATSEVYSLATRQWMRAGNMSAARKEFAAGSLPDGSALIAGGENSEQMLNVAERFNPLTFTWQTITGPMPDTVAELPMVVLSDGSVLITGGTRSDTFYTTSRLGGIFKPWLTDPD